MHLDDRDPELFSLSKAYDLFQQAASYGHLIASYNVGVMNFLGIGSYKSCSVAA